MIFKPELVQFSNGKYGVRAKFNFLFLKWEFVSTNPEYTFLLKHHVKSMCQFETTARANEILSKYVELNSKLSYKKLT